MDAERTKRAGVEAAVAVVAIVVVALVINVIGGSWQLGPLLAFIAVFALVWFLVRAFGPVRGRQRGSSG